MAAAVVLPVLIDDRVGSRTLVKHPPLNEIGELSRLPSGDVCITGNGKRASVLVGVEVKTITDLIASIDSGRLQATQLPRLLEEYDERWLLYYGAFRPNPETGALQVFRGNRKSGGWKDYTLGPTRVVPYGYPMSFLCSPSFTRLGVNVHRVHNEQEAAAWIGVLARTWAKPFDAHKSMRTFDRSGTVAMTPGMDPKLYRRAQSISALVPGLGYERAMAAAKHFGSVREMAVADEKEWAEITGIGKVLAGVAVREYR